VKILFVCGGGFVYGKEIITLSLMQGLRERGHDVRCIISSWAHDDYDRRLAAEAIPFISLPLGFISKTLTAPAMRMTVDTLSKSPKLWLGYRRHLKDFQPDAVVHSTLHHIYHVWPLLDARNTFFHVHDPFAPTAFYRRLFRFLSLRVRAFIGVSRYIEQSIVDLGVAPEKVFSVLNGITPPLSREANGNAAKLNLSPPEREANEEGAPVRVGIVGQIGEWKGHDDFVEALRELKRAGLSFSVLIFGEGQPEYVAALKRKIDDYQLTQEVRWPGFVKNPAEIFSSMDICVVPSRSQDPCPTVAIETTHFGIPVIATRRGGLPEIVQDNSTGYLVDAESPSQLADKLKLLIQDAGLRQRMSRAAKAYGSEHLSSERMAAQMEAALMKAVGLAPVMTNQSMARAAEKGLD
jgi:glycosyltransferase involved in cell wall biosynthesis